jgi:hypothetical protein
LEFSPAGEDPHSDHGLGSPLNLALTRCPSYLNPYCLGRKTAFFFSGHLNLHAKPETGIPYREKKIITKLKKAE